MASRLRLLPSLLRSRLLHHRRLCTADADAAARLEAHRKLHDLDFTSAAEILSTYPKKKFGFDFHLVQFFFACMPSLAVFLVAQYSRYEMRKMEAELELKKKAEEEEKAKAEEEEKAKAAELEPVEEGCDSNLSKVIGRLDVLEETIKEIVNERKKANLPNPSAGQVVGKSEKAAPTEDTKVTVREACQEVGKSGKAAPTEDTKVSVKEPSSSSASTADRC